MHPINRLLSVVGLRLSRAVRPGAGPVAGVPGFDAQFQEARQNERGFGAVLAYPTVETGEHPASYVDHECAFAAQWLGKAKPVNVLDVGSYRHFVLGMLSWYRVTTVDIRHRKAMTENEVVLTCDARSLKLPDGGFDVVVSLCALEHIGLGRYGDEFDLDGDKKAFGEMVRVLRPGGRIIFTTAVTRGPSCMRFNQARFYSYEMIRGFWAGLVCEEERFYSHKLDAYCSLADVTHEENSWDVYCGCWRRGPF